MNNIDVAERWAALRRSTPARIGLGRTGCGLPTSEVLSFSAAHARARDAVDVPLDVERVTAAMHPLGLDVIHVHSAAPDRATYLRRPDLGRMLNEDSQSRLQAVHPPVATEVLFVVADGLSAVAVENHAPALLQILVANLEDKRIGPVVVGQQARVALGDEIGAAFEAEIVVVLIGERPGLSVSDSLGVYVTYQPKPGRTDAERNCISNIHSEGLSYECAARQLTDLILGALRLRLTGVGLKLNDSATLIP